MQTNVLGTARGQAADAQSGLAQAARMGRSDVKVLQAIPQPKNTRWQMQTLAVEITEIQTETRWMANTKYENSNRKLSSNCFYQSPQSWFHPFCASTYTEVDAMPSCKDVL